MKKNTLDNYDGSHNQKVELKLHFHKRPCITYCCWRCDIQHNSNQNNDTRHNKKKRNNQHNDFQPNDSIVMLSVAMLNVSNKPFMHSVIMLNVVILSVAAPSCCRRHQHIEKIDKLLLKLFHPAI